MNISDFIGKDAKAAVLGDPEAAGKLLAEILGLGDAFFGNALMWRYPRDLCNDRHFDLTHEAEFATVEKVGADAYGRALHELVFPTSEDLTAADGVFANDAKIATASAPVRVAAMLLALERKENER